MEGIIGDILKITIPAALVLTAMYLATKSFIARELDKKELKIKTNNAEAALPIRLQAFERMTLFLERISPDNLFPRINRNDLTADELRYVAINEISNEYQHNLAQQIYMSEDSWQQIKNAKEFMISSINDAASRCEKNAPGLELAKIVLSESMQDESNPVISAMITLKNEIRKIF
ncbi:hypothetical protein OO013_13960 [Mangrovivirga sp. M17]|uniref:Uncharacterized protein n=1 Tax=Mangrovivirga halotolerans TaxID=2993936 RepID=A0ABT3RT61_9BACT|nr:hypothetical protein [Mangrovivirga halotolerans]MCX2744983.1 hypothetical protein [Mangrovivirga halotolerans]